MNAIEFLSQRGASCAGGGVDWAAEKALRENEEEFQNGMKELGGTHSEAGPEGGSYGSAAKDGDYPTGPKGIEGIAPAVDGSMNRVRERVEKWMEEMPERPGFWARLFGRGAAAEAAALRRRLVARDEQIEVLKKRVLSLREDLWKSRSLHMRAKMHLHLMSGTIERLEPVTIRHRNRAAHYERRFTEMQSELAATRDALELSELARRQLIAAD